MTPTIAFLEAGSRMRKTSSINMKQKLRWILLSAVVGIFAGLASALFLWSLQKVTDFRELHAEIIWCLPLAGLLIGFSYERWGRRAAGGTALVLDEIHEPQKILPFTMVPLVLGGTLLTHLTGGSAGREGTAVQMGASLADQLTRWIPLEKEERKILLVTGMGAGFSSAIGAPLAGALFGLEILQIGKLRLFALLECLVASFVAFFICRAVGAPHSIFPRVEFFWSFKAFFTMLLAGLIFGALVRVFVYLTHMAEKAAARIVPPKRWRACVGGFLLLVLFLIFGLERFRGLGISTIQEAFFASSPWEDAPLKLILTALTLGMGFKGGEFIPLVFIGATAGSFLAGVTGLPVALFAGVGFSAVFGAASNAPIACALMAGELLGWPMFLPALLTGFIAYWSSGAVGIYSSQRTARSKTDQLFYLWRKLAWKSR